MSYNSAALVAAPAFGCRSSIKGPNIIGELYKNIIYIIQHQIGCDKQNAVEKSEILNYLQKAFNADDESHKKILKETQKEKKSNMTLNVEVIEAKELSPKDANGKSDPYCVVYLNSKPKRAYQTSIQFETLSPVWQEHFAISLEHPESDILAVEVWDWDDFATTSEAITKVKTVRGFKGLVKYAKDVTLTATLGQHGNELIGNIQIPLKDIPLDNEVIWYTIEKKGKARNRGSVSLRMSFCSTHYSRMAYQDHRHLLRILLKHELKLKDSGMYRWNNQWQKSASAIILQHVIQRGISSKYSLLARYIEFSEVHYNNPLNYEVFYDLRQELKDLLNNQSFSEEEMSDYWVATRRLLYVALDVLRQIRRLQCDPEHRLNQLEIILKIIAEIKFDNLPKNFKMFPLKMYSWFPEDVHVKDDIELLDALECAIIKGTNDWFEYYVLSSDVIDSKDTDAINRCIDIIHAIEADLKEARDEFEKIFVETINYPYTRIVYITYEKKISEMCTAVVKNISSKFSVTDLSSWEILCNRLFTFYFVVQQFADLGQILCPEQTLEHMQISCFHDWFEPGVIFWLSMTCSKARSVIDRAIEFDKFQPVDSSVRYSSSAMDLLTIFHEIKDFWLKLTWPEGEKTYKILMKIVDDICRCSLVYVDRISAKFNEECTDFMTSTLVNLLTKSFYVSSSWCYSVNNIYYIKTSIDSLFVNDFQVEKVFQTIDRTMSPVNAKQSEQKLRSIMDETKGTMDNLVTTMHSSIVTNMTPTMARLLKDGTDQFDSNKPLMDKLMEYLDQNLHTLHANLNEIAFQKCLQLLWGVMFELFHRLTEDSLMEKRTPSFYTNLHQTLLMLIRFFHLGKEEQDYGIITKIEHLLKLYGSDTSELVYNYYKDRLQQQNNQDHEFFGILTVKAYFIYDKLYLQILNARNLKSVDKKCNTYVETRLYPDKIYGSNVLKTGVQKDTQFPLYDGKFEVVLTPEQKKYRDGLIAFEVLMREYFKSKFLAECFLSLSDIPQISDSSGIAAEIATLKQVHIKLSRPTDLNHRVLSILSNRKGDSSAANFATKEATRVNAKLNYT